MNRSDISPYALGATLYMPGTRTDLLRVMRGQAIPGLRSMVICLEDAVSEADLAFAIKNVTAVLNEYAGDGEEYTNKPLAFIRPRDLKCCERILREMDINALAGVVIPKIRQENLECWHNVLRGTDLKWMLTLETAESHDLVAMREFAEQLKAYRNQILVLRVGGNDLMSSLAIRRPRMGTLYDSALGFTLKMLLCTFKPHGFAMTAPVCEIFDESALLYKEVETDVLHGFCGKTAIHPCQIPIIQSAFKVNQNEYEDALLIANASEAVFKSNGAMCEPATHSSWARLTLERAKYFGIANVNEFCVDRYNLPA